jgi:hypothetical protein
MLCDSTQLRQPGAITLRQDAFIFHSYFLAICAAKPGDGDPHQFANKRHYPQDFVKKTTLLNRTDCIRNQLYGFIVKSLRGGKDTKGTMSRSCNKALTSIGNFPLRKLPGPLRSLARHALKLNSLEFKKH